MSKLINLFKSVIRLAERLYYKLTHKDICDMYNY